MHHPLNRRLAIIFSLLMLLAAGAPRGATAQELPQAETQEQQVQLEQQETSGQEPQADIQAGAALAPVSYWGMNVYVTKRERLGAGDNLTTLAQTGRNAGVQWTREELTWVHIEPSNNSYQTLYDSSLRLTADQGYQIIGMLLTTPTWAIDPACVTLPGAPRYWCPPANVNEYAQALSWLVERYDGDGVQDAPGSPRIAAWEIWNEPNNPVHWPKIGTGWAASRARYGNLLVAAYNAVKAADSTARVMIGGVYIFDGRDCNDSNCDGAWFLNGTDGVFKHVPAARQAFDVLGIHPFMPTAPPDGSNVGRLYTIEGRIRTVRNMLNHSTVGRSNAAIWITEVGWCTAPASGSGQCPGGVTMTQDQQANYLVRTMAIAQQNGVQHTSWFQLDDAFNNPMLEWSECAVVSRYNGTIYPVKKAYNAYKTMAGTIAGGIPIGSGPLHTHVYDASKPYDPETATYDYRYDRGTATVDVLWRNTGTLSVQFPLWPGNTQAVVVSRDGTRQTVNASNGKITLTLSESPIYVEQSELIFTPTDWVYLPLVRR